VPSEQERHPDGLGQSESCAQAGAGQLVRVALHLAETQSTAGQAAEPSLHSSQATPSRGQSPRVRQLAPWSQISGAHTQLSWP
jgi:hypothetical protein